jgi:hypothetical protein
MDRLLIYHMSQLSMLRILPLLILASPLAAVARDATPIVPMTLGQKYSGSLTPSPSNPQGEICYGLSVEPDTRITLKVKTTGAGIIKFAVYDQTKALRFFHNDVNGKKSKAAGETLSDSRFSFPVISDISQLCLTTTNPDRGQQYNFTATAKPIRKAKKRLALRPVAATAVVATPSKKPAPEAPTPVKTPPAPTIETPPPPVGEPYCYVGTWQISDLTGYWLPTIQNFTQAKITEPQMLGYGKLTINKDGNAFFESFDLEQRYTLKSPDGLTRIEKIGVSIGGSSRARYQANADSTLTFSSQEYQRLSTKLNLGASLKFTGDRLFMLFGDRDLPPVKLGYKCIDRDNIFLRIPLPGGQKTLPVALKRIN